MEDWTNILWFLLIGVSAVVSLISKRNEEKNKKQTPPEEPEEEWTPHTPDSRSEMPPFGPIHTSRQAPQTTQGASDDRRGPSSPHTERPVSRPVSHTADSTSRTSESTTTPASRPDYSRPQTPLERPKHSASTPESSARPTQVSSARPAQPISGSLTSQSTQAPLHSAASHISSNSVTNTPDHFNFEAYDTENPLSTPEITDALDETMAGVQNNSIMEGFELQKAVVWAEILKPKFSDESL